MRAKLLTNFFFMKFQFRESSIINLCPARVVEPVAGVHHSVRARSGTGEVLSSHYREMKLGQDTVDSGP